MGSTGAPAPLQVANAKLKTFDWGSEGLMVSMDQQGTVRLFLGASNLEDKI